MDNITPLTPRKFSFKNASSDIDNITYYVDQLRLVVEFRKGRVYEYSPVSGELYHGLFLAPSVGKFIREKIINNKDIIATQVKVGEFSPGTIKPKEENNE